MFKPNTNREIREMFDISNRAAVDEICRLMNLDVVERKGKRRSVYYVLK